MASAGRRGVERMPKIVRATVKGLLDDFDHQVDFPQSWPFVLIYGPNGIGKTKFLELIDFASSMRFANLAEIPFDRLELAYDDDTRFIIQRTQSHDSAIDISREDPDGFKFEAILEQPYALMPVTWEFERRTFHRNLREYLESATSWTPIEGGRWVDTDDGEVVDDIELMERYRHASSRMRRMRRQETGDPPAEFVKFLHSAPVRLIATQRLLTNAPVRRNADIRKSGYQKSTISEYSEELISVLKQALAGHSKASQQLDRSFPRRLLSRTSVTSGNDDHRIRERYAQRCLFLDPTGTYIGQREAEEGHTTGVLSSLTDLNIRGLQRVQRRVRDDALGAIQIRTCDAPVRFNITIVDEELCVMQPYLPQARGVESPTFVARKSNTDGIFNTFATVFESMWNDGRETVTG
ncbi:DUF5919 domain-containing protein [Nocardia sp. NPDC049190]|uniref:DUF5919 domain-containing protein n=1 Tax=Nocardia sp. NPDC049190 TaxID=3155650 RepID=UPI00340C2BA0